AGTRCRWHCGGHARLWPAAYSHGHDEQGSGGVDRRYAGRDPSRQQRWRAGVAGGHSARRFPCAKDDERRWPLIPYRDAQRLVLDQAGSFGTKTVALEQAGGRVLSGIIRADRDYPPFPRATMDGYAMRFNDLEQGIQRFTVAETIMAGHAAVRGIGPGECYKIMTGAAVPESADIVIRRENMEEGTGYARILPILPDPLPAGVLPAPADPRFPWRRYQNIARQGEDLAAGAVVIDRPVVCEPAVIGLLATLGQTRITVERIPRIGLLTTGNEV